MTALFTFCLLAFFSFLYFGQSNFVILPSSTLTFASFLSSPLYSSGKFSIWDFVFQDSEASFVSLLQSVSLIIVSVSKLILGYWGFGFIFPFKEYWKDFERVK